MDMKSSRNTIIPIVLGIVVAIVLKFIGQGWGIALIIGAIVAIAASVVLQRMGGSTARESGNTSGGASSPADIDALLATANSAVTGFATSTAEIGNPATKEIAGKIGTNLTGIMTALQLPDKRSAAPTVVDNLIEPAQSVLTEYLFLTRKAIASATPRATEIETRIIPAIETASRQTLSLLQEPGKPDLTKIDRASTVPFERGVTMPPSGTTSKGSREVKPGT